MDGVDNNGNGLIDEGQERYTIGNLPSEWANAIDNRLLIKEGRSNRFLMDGTRNPWFIEGGDEHLRGDGRYNDKTFTMEFDVFEWDFGDDGVAGDWYHDSHGDGVEDRGEPGQGGGIGQSYTGYYDFGLDGFLYYPGLDDNGDGHQAVWSYITIDGIEVQVNIYDINGDPIWIDGPDEGENDGVFQPGDTWQDAGDFYVSDSEAG